MNQAWHNVNHGTPQQAHELLQGLYEHSPWLVEAVLPKRPFASPAALKWALAQALDEAGVAAQEALIRAHPELAGKAALAGTLTSESTDEQSRAGLAHCSAGEYAELHQLNHDYQARFGWPFILAVRGPRGTGLNRTQILQAMRRRLHSTPEAERRECVRQIHRIAELRLNDKLGLHPQHGNQVWDWAEHLAQHSDEGFAQRGELATTYLTPAHRAVAAQLAQWMRACGFDDVHHDAVGNVVGVYHGQAPDAPRLLTGSHYDTVRNGGKYDGRLGILVPMACVQQLHAAGERLPFGLEVVGFAEEEGQRYKAAFLGSSALVGNFDTQWLEQADANGITMRQAMADAGLDPAGIAALKRDAARYLGFVEVHIEQGPVLCQAHQPLGVVSAINGSVRWRGEVRGTASHAGTTPMGQRADAAMVVAEWMVALEARAQTDGDSVATVGML